MILEPAVTLSDFALSIECGWFVSWLVRRAARRDLIASGFTALFAGVGLAALFGGITHGFLPDPNAPLHRFAWTGTLLAIGVAALGSWVVAAHLWLRPLLAGAVTLAAALLFAVYVALVLWHSQSFFVAIAHYLPAAVFLFVAFVAEYRRRRSNALAFGICGVALTFLAALVQQLGLGLHPVYFDHNTLYHVIQAAALLLIFLAARLLVTRLSR